MLYRSANKKCDFLFLRHFVIYSIVLRPRCMPIVMKILSHFMLSICLNESKTHTIVVMYKYFIPHYTLIVNYSLVFSKLITLTKVWILCIMCKAITIHILHWNGLQCDVMTYLEVVCDSFDGMTVTGDILPLCLHLSVHNSNLIEHLHVDSVYNWPLYFNSMSHWKLHLHFNYVKIKNLWGIVPVPNELKTEHKELFIQCAQVKRICYL